MPKKSNELTEILFFRVNQQFAGQLRRLARKSNQTLSGFIRQALEMIWIKPDPDYNDRLCQ
jgi:hypothetical protein